MNYYQAIKKTTEFKYNLKEELYKVKSLKQTARIFKEYQKFSAYKKRGIRPLFKDPIALFSSEWLASTFDMDVVILIRHPAAFAGSLKVKNWGFPFSHFLQQPLLMKKKLAPFKSEIEYYAQKDQDTIDQAILLWRIIHQTILEYQQKHRDWSFIRHEDISLNPLSGFQNLFDCLSLDLSEPIKKTIIEHSNYEAQNKEQSFFLKRDSKSNTTTWQDRLTTSEIERIYDGVKDVSKAFYSDREWE